MNNTRIKNNHYYKFNKNEFGDSLEFRANCDKAKIVLIHCAHTGGGGSKPHFNVMLFDENFNKIELNVVDIHGLEVGEEVTRR